MGFWEKLKTLKQLSLKSQKYYQNNFQKQQVKCLGVFAKTKGDSRALMCSSVPAMKFPGRNAVSCNVWLTEQRPQETTLLPLSLKKAQPCLQVELSSLSRIPPISASCAPARMQEGRCILNPGSKPESSGKSAGSSSCSRFSREWRNTSCCCVWTRGCPLPSQHQFCNPGCSAWLSWSWALPVHSNPTKPWTHWHTSEGSHTFPVSLWKGWQEQQWDPKPLRTTWIRDLPVRCLHSMPPIIQAAPGALI